MHWQIPRMLRVCFSKPVEPVNSENNNDDDQNGRNYNDNNNNVTSLRRIARSAG